MLAVCFGLAEAPPHTNLAEPASSKCLGGTDFLSTFSVCQVLKGIDVPSPRC